MQIRRLGLTGFRSYRALEVELPPGPQVVFGANAAGKTNLLEAIVLAGRGLSHRAGSDAELITWGEPFARVEVELVTAGGRQERIELALLREGPGRKRVRINGVPRRTSALAATLPLVLFAPEEMLLVAGSPSLRRASLDALGAARSPAHGRSLATYARALQQRNSLLRAIRDGLADPNGLAYWDRLVVEEGGGIVAERLALLEALARPLAAAHAEIAPDEGRLGLRYVTNAPALEDETPADALRRRLAETRDKELWNGATLVGPHRDDVTFVLDERELAGFGSRGQQRTAILALKLAELELLTSVESGPPLLLLDDVFSELDPERRSHLVRRIRALPQAIVTTTTLADLDPELVAESTAWRVSPGRLERVAGAAVAGLT
ncbi:MAG TPA: DNA replication/repair protein RecF [Candidatus Limnocylindrales bacterium]|nr:DNA replication/repair protein RecF [Candidatus Limnocylindrales bacterium]